MEFKDTPRHFGPISRAFHGLGALLVLAGLGAVECVDFFDKGSSTRSGLMAIHIQVGLLVLALTLPRILWRLRQSRPAITPPPPALQHLAARITHGALYLLLLALPISGTLMRQAHGATVSLFGLSLPSFLGADESRFHALHEFHEVLGNGLVVLLVLHIAASLYHHFVQRDDTLLRMLSRGR